MIDGLFPSPGATTAPPRIVCSYNERSSFLLIVPPSHRVIQNVIAFSLFQCLSAWASSSPLAPITLNPSSEKLVIDLNILHPLSSIHPVYTPVDLVSHSPARHNPRDSPPKKVACFLISHLSSVPLQSRPPSSSRVMGSQAGGFPAASCIE